MSRKKIVIATVAVLAAVLAAMMPAFSQAYSPDDQRLAEALSRDLAAAPWSRGKITGLAYDEENKQLLVAWTDGYFDLWDVVKGSKRRVNASLARQEDRALGPESLRFTRDKQGFFTNSSANGIQLWDVKSGEMLHALSASKPYLYQGPVTYTGTGDVYLLSGLLSGMQFFDGRKMTLSPATRAIGRSMPVVAVDPQARLAAIGSTEASFKPDAANHLQLFRLTADDGPPKLSPLKKIEFSNDAGGYLRAAAFAQNGQSLYTVSTSGRVDEWSVPALENIKTQTLGLKGLYEAEFWPDQGLLAVAGFTGLNRVDGDQLVKVISLASGQAVTAPVTSIETKIVFIPTIDKVLAIHGRRASLIDPRRQSPEESQEGRRSDSRKNKDDPAALRPEPPRKADPRNKYPGFVEKFAADHRAQKEVEGSWDTMVHSLAYDEKHQRLIVGRESGKIDIWDLNTSSRRTMVPAEGEFQVRDLSFDADGRHFFAHLLSAKNAIHIWDAATGERLHTAPGFRGQVFYTGIEDLYLMHKLYELYFLDGNFSRKTLISSTPGRGVAVLAVDEKNTAAAIYMNDSLGLYRFFRKGAWPALETAGESVPYSPAGGMGTAFFDPEGKNLYIVLNRPGRLEQWSVPGLKKINSQPLGFAVVTQAMVSPDKKLLALAGLPDPPPEDGRYVVKLMKLASGRSVVEPMNSSLIAIAFVPDLNALLAVHGSSTTVFELP